ncbi:uncharacterized protein LOC134671191 [Cydia fagiglandana]|uniref:uncharacterized protein LOC134671191 n=1 Tax=Cydia fagiglandana TaxID=1458189 RepID=UPI002FEE4B5F
MLRYTICLVLVLSPVLTRHVPRFAELDAEEQQLYRAAYDTPSYDHDEYQEEDLEPGKLDLLKDGLWAIKAKIKELKAFDKALAANVLTTKLKLKELLEYHLKKKPIELVVEKKKPVSYQSYPQAPAYPPQPQYEPQYAAPPPAYHHDHDPYYGH